MANHKKSPDVLAELLGPEPLGSQPQPKPARQRAPRASGPVEASPSPASQAAPVTWEMEVVTFQEHRGWRPHYVNGVELQNWLAGPLVHDYLSQRGAEGWELAGASTADHFYGRADNLQLYFKRHGS